MRTTLTIEDSLARKLKSLAQRSGRSFKQVVNDAIRAGLVQRPKVKPYRLRPTPLGGAMPGVDLRKALQIAEALEDLEIARKLDLRK